MENSNSSTIYEIENWTLSFSLGKAIFTLVSTILCFLTATGNVLVLLSFRVNKKLRTTNNYFLISLAIADVIIGFVSMPISSVYIITEKWLFGPYICDLWLSLDYTVSNASVGSLLLISFDRYFSITRPLTYRVNRTTRKVAFLIALSWLISILMWSPLILLWPYFQGNRIIKDDVCKIQFLLANRFVY
jgi:muscarinic acetylcholine receptor M3